MEDLLEAGVLDPAKVTRSGLTNACGIAGIMLTTQARLLRPDCIFIGQCFESTVQKHRWKKHVSLLHRLHPRMG